MGKLVSLNENFNIKRKKIRLEMKNQACLFRLDLNKFDAAAPGKLRGASLPLT